MQRHRFHWTPLLVFTGFVRGIIVIVGILLLVFSTNDVLRLFGILAIVFGALRLYMLLRTAQNSNEGTDDTV